MPIQQTDVRGVIFTAQPIDKNDIVIIATSVDNHHFTLEDRGNLVYTLLAPDRVSLIRDMRALAQSINDMASKLQMYKVPEPKPIIEEVEKPCYIICKLDDYDESIFVTVATDWQEMEDTVDTLAENARSMGHYDARAYIAYQVNDNGDNEEVYRSDT